MFRFFVSRRNKRLIYAGVIFIANDAKALLALIPAHADRAHKALQGLSLNRPVRLNADWTVSWVENGAVVIYTPPGGLDTDSYAKAVATFNPHGIDLGHCPWPWLDDPKSVLVVQMALYNIQKGYGSSPTGRP